jgi:hypothetical protein
MTPLYVFTLTNTHADRFIYMSDSPELPRKRPSRHLGLPEIEGWEQLMWSLWQHLKAGKGLDKEDEPAITLPVGNVVTRGRDLRGTKPYFVGKLSANFSRCVLVLILLKLLAPTLKKSKPRIKVEVQAEVEPKIKSEKKAEDEEIEQAQKVPGTSESPGTEKLSMKRNSPEHGNQEKQGEIPEPESDQVSNAKKANDQARFVRP